MLVPRLIYEKEPVRQEEFPLTSKQHFNPIVTSIETQSILKYLIKNLHNQKTERETINYLKTTKEEHEILQSILKELYIKREKDERYSLSPISTPEVSI